jgi:uncharacterized damage-inducible protein DinB
MLTKDQRLETIAKIRRLPSIIEAAVKGLNEAQLDTPYGEGKWTVRQVVHHLADSHLMAFARTKQMLVEAQPNLFAYDQNEWAKTPDATASSPIGPSLTILRGVHERWGSLLEAIPESAWTRKGIHFRRGQMTLDDLLSLYAHHGENHVKQITDLRTQQGW